MKGKKTHFKKALQSPMNKTDEETKSFEGMELAE